MPLVAVLLAGCQSKKAKKEAEHLVLARKEAHEMLGKLAKAAIESFRRKPAPSPFAAGQKAKPPPRQLCDSAPAPVPKQLRKGKFQALPTDWFKGDPTVGFNCLRFSIDDPQWCQYSWTRTSPTHGLAAARCDPNGKGKAVIEMKVAVTCKEDDCTQQAVD